MQVAFYAPLKPPDHPVPSGDRRTAQFLFEALRLGGHQPFLVSRLRSFDGMGDPSRQARVARIGERLANRLLCRWRRHPAAAPELWFTYHLYHKAPDHLGPAISAALGIPYVITEASYAPKQTGGRWDIGQVAVERALRRADAIIGFNPADRACVLPFIGDVQRWFAMLPFLDASVYPEPLRGAAIVPRLIAVAMMRPGDKADSYRILGEALAGLLDLPWALDVVGDGRARAEVEIALRPAGSRVHILVRCSPTMCARLWECRSVCLAGDQRSVLHGHPGGAGGRVAGSGWKEWRRRYDCRRGNHWFAGAVRRCCRVCRSGAVAFRGPGMRTAMGSAARAKILRVHDLSAAAQRLGRVIEELCPARAA